jgi:hypothetical protein
LEGIKNIIPTPMMSLSLFLSISPAMVLLDCLVCFQVRFYIFEELDPQRLLAKGQNSHVDSGMKWYEYPTSKELSSNCRASNSISWLSGQVSNRPSPYLGVVWCVS